MCMPIKKDLRLKLNEKGEGFAYKLFTGYKTLRPLCGNYGRFEKFKINSWVKSPGGPGFFMYLRKKEAENDGWAYTHIKKIKFRKVAHEGTICGKPIIVAKEIFIPKEA